MVKHILLLTATIIPMQGLPSLARTDPDQRLRDYKKALHFYLGQLAEGAFYGIVFAENSRANLAVLQDLVSAFNLQDKVEFISFDGLDFSPSKGRGYGEFKLVDHAVAHSMLIASHPDATVWKCTGRYIVKNIAKIIKKSPRHFNLYCHSRNYPWAWCELYLVAWDGAGYTGFIKGVYENLANDITPGAHTFEEVRFRSCIDLVKNQLRVEPRFRVTPLIDGTRGWNNSEYSDRWYSPKLAARRLANVLIPCLWI